MWLRRILRKDKESDTVLYIIGWCILGALLLLMILWRLTGTELFRLFGGCMFYRLTGCYCPGCGGTRAMKALFARDVWASFVYHPFVPYIALLGGWFMLSQTIERLSKGRIRIAMHFREVYLWVTLAIIGVNVIVKNVALLVYGVDLMAF